MGYKSGLLTKKEIEIYNKPQCSGEELERIKKFHEKLDLSSTMTLVGMWIIFHKELRVLNLNKINTLEQLYIKRINYHKYLKRMRNKIKR